MQLFCNPWRRTWAFVVSSMLLIFAVTMTAVALSASTPRLTNGANLMIAAHTFAVLQFLAALLPDEPLLDRPYKYTSTDNL